MPYLTYIAVFGSGIEYLIRTNNIKVFDSYFLTSKYIHIDRLQYVSIRLFDHLLAAYFFGPPCIWRQIKVRGLGLGCGCSPALCVTRSAAKIAVCGLWALYRCDAHGGIALMHNIFSTFIVIFAFVFRHDLGGHSISGSNSILKHRVRIFRPGVQK